MRTGPLLHGPGLSPAPGASGCQRRAGGRQTKEARPNTAAGSSAAGSMGVWTTSADGGIMGMTQSTGAWHC